MTTKKKSQSPITPELQTYLDEIAAKHQPDPAVLHRRIESAEARYNRTQRFADNPALLMDNYQSLIMDGWRLDLRTPMAVMSNNSVISVTLIKPDSLIERELEALRTRISGEYHNELLYLVEAEIDALIAEAAEDAKRQAEEQATAQQSTMRDQLRNLLTQGIA